MDENRIQNYLNLIQQLLNCPSGEEPEILNTNSDLVDAGLVKEMQRIAEVLKEGGNSDAANFLINIANHLADALGLFSLTPVSSPIPNPDSQFRFLLNILQATHYNKGNPQVVYSLLAVNIDQINENFTQILRNWATTTLSQVELEQAWMIAADINNFSNRIRDFPLGNRATNLEIAITGFEIVSTIFTRDSSPENWAKLQNNLGLTYLYRNVGDRANNLEKAISYHQQALLLHTREASSEYWAMTQTYLGNAYLYRILGNRADNLEQAINHYNQALLVYTHQNSTESWANTQSSLGEAYRNRILGNRADNLEQAINYCRQALLVLTPNILPELWGRIQNILGAAYIDRILGDKADNLEQGINYYRQALLAQTREAFPRSWAGIQNNLGTAYSYRILGNRADNLEQAINCSRQALLVWTHETFPEYWAATQNNLGYIYNLQIVKDHLEQAISYYKQALLVYSREAFPEQWATTQNNLGFVYSYRILGDKVDNLQQAISHYSQALTIRTRNAFPEKWAETHHQLGYAYSDLSSIPNAISRSELRILAIKCFTKSLEIRTREAYPQYYAVTKFGLGIAYQRNNQLPLAEDTFADAINTVETLRYEIISGDEAKQKLAEGYNRLYQHMVEVCLQLITSKPDYYTKAIEYVERSKARNLVELIATRDLYPKGDIPQTVLNELSRLRREITAEQRRLNNEQTIYNSYGSIMSGERNQQLSQLQSTIPDRTHLNQLQQQLDELITRNIKPIDLNFSLTQKVEPIPYNDIQSLTGENTAILEWYITGDKFLTFIITPQSPTPIIWQSSTADFKKLVRWANGYLLAYDKKKKDHWKRRLSVRLRLLAKILHLDDILKNIPQQCDRLILIPHRFLHLFPLHALPVSQETWLQFKPNSDSSPTNPYLLDCFVGGVGYAPSCQLLQQAQKRQRPYFSHLFAIANPTSDRYLLELQAANIGHQFQSNDLLVRDNANKNAILNSNISLANCVHFGCHGKFNPDSPLESALYLANNERLTLLEILNLDLNQCRLVTLCAEETGLTESKTSDEYIGLPFGFLLAGSPSIVSTLWEVDQLASTLLLIRFYENIKTLSTVAALNEAQQWLRNLTSEELEAVLERLKPQIDQTFKELPLKERRRYVNAPLNAARERKHQPFPFAEAHYWAGFTAIGV